MLLYVQPLHKEIVLKLDINKIIKSVSIYRQSLIFLPTTKILLGFLFESSYLHQNSSKHLNNSHLQLSIFYRLFIGTIRLRLTLQRIDNRVYIQTWTRLVVIKCEFGSCCTFFSSLLRTFYPCFCRLCLSFISLSYHL